MIGLRVNIFSIKMVKILVFIKNFLTSVILKKVININVLGYVKLHKNMPLLKISKKILTLKI